MKDNKFKIQFKYISFYVIPLLLQIFVYIKNIAKKDTMILIYFEIAVQIEFCMYFLVVPRMGKHIKMCKCVRFSCATACNCLSFFY